MCGAMRCHLICVRQGMEGMTGGARKYRGIGQAAALVVREEGFRGACLRSCCPVLSRVVSCCLVLSRVVSCCLVLSRVVSCCLVLSRVVSCCPVLRCASDVDAAACGMIDTCHESLFVCLCAYGCVLMKRVVGAGLFKGNSANVARAVPVYGLKFALNDQFKVRTHVYVCACVWGGGLACAVEAPSVCGTMM